MPKEVQYCVAQLEHVQRDHLQGYCELKKRRVLSSIKRIMSAERIHIESRRGTQEQAMNYCTDKKADPSSIVRGDNAWSFAAGEPKTQGIGKDNIANCVKAIDEGQTYDQIDDQFPIQMTMHKNKLYDRMIKARGQRKLVPNKNNVYIFQGPSGTGKTTTAWEKWPDAYKGTWPTGGRWWWPDYYGQKTIIFDEYRENISYQQMLALLDIHPMDIEYKGGNSHNVSKRIVITTVRDPVTWYKGVEDKTELERRINENCTIVNFKEGGKYPNFKKTKRVGKFAFNEFVPKYDFSNTE